MKSDNNNSTRNTADNMKRLIKNFILTLLTAMMCSATTACSDSEDSTSPRRETGTTFRRSVLIYLAAQNSLGKAGASRLDSMEIVEGASRLTNNLDNVFLFIDDAKLPRLYCIYKYGRRTVIEKILTWSDDIYSTDPATLYSVLKTIDRDYPSKSYGLVLWSHGNGWLVTSNTVNTLRSNGFSARSFGIDVGPGGNLSDDTDASGITGPQMNISDMSQAIARSGVHLDYIFFDACLMQNIEVAYELKDVTDYVVGSATSTSAYGGYYTNLIPKALFAYPASDANVSLIASQYYYDAVDNASLHKYYKDFGNVNSVIKTAHLKELAQTTAPLVAKVFANKTTPQLNGIQTYYSHAIAYSPDYFDMGSAMKHILSNDDYKAWLRVAKKSIIQCNASPSFIMAYVNDNPLPAKVNDRDNILGVSMFIPRALFDGKHGYPAFNTQFQSTAWYNDAGWSETEW